MRKWLLIAGVAALFGGGLQASAMPGAIVGTRPGDDSLEKIQKELQLVRAKGGAKNGPDVKEVERLIGRAMDLGIDHKGEEAGFDAYAFILDHSGMLGEERQVGLYTEVMDALLESWLDDDRLGSIVLSHMSLDYPVPALKKPAADYLAWVERDSKAKSVKAACAFLRAIPEINEVSTAADAKKMTLKLEALKKTYGELAANYGRTYGQLLDEQIETLKVIGSPAKEIAAKDLDGVEFKLSDYKGKVVLLDFWGYW